VPLNVALPPLDDIEVRRAINLVIDRAAVVEATPGRIGTTLRVAHHAIPDSLQNNLLLDYDPFPTTGDRGDLSAAREAMARSRYDDDGDGRCDAPACDRVPVSIWPGDEGATDVVSENVSALGITLEPRTDDAFPYDVRARNGMVVLAGWIADTPALGGFISPFFRAPIKNEDGAESISATLIGSAPDDLEDWGYEPTDVPSVDAKVDECLSRTGSQRFICAAELDQLVTEQAVAIVPIALPEVGFLYGERVVSYSIDQSVVAPALDQIAVTP
jgi:ABC-type transport system substrate-binding protein